MPVVSFRIESLGLGPASWSQFQIAIQRGRGMRMAQRLYTLNTLGTSGASIGPLIVGTAETIGAHTLPDEHEGKIFPATLDAKYLKIALAGGYSVGTSNVTVTFEIKELRQGAYVELYKWEGPIQMSTTYLGGITVEGVPITNDVNADWVQERISDLMSS